MMRSSAVPAGRGGRGPLGGVVRGHLNMGSDTSDLPAGIGKPAQRALAAAGVFRLKQFTRMSETAVLRLHGMGPKALGVIRLALAARGQSFANEPPPRGRARKRG